MKVYWWRRLSAGCLLAVLSIGTLCPMSFAALADDIPACRCLENLAMADDAQISEDLRREAVRILDDYCEEDRPLSDLSGHAQWIAQESCVLLHQEFQMDTEMLSEEEDTRGLEVRLAVQTNYYARRLMYQNIVDWRHDVALFARIHLTFRPAKSQRMAGGAP